MSAVSVPAWRAFAARHRFLIVFTLLTSLMGTSVGLAKVATTLYALHLGAGGLALGLIAAAQSAGILVTSLPIGLLVERRPPLQLFLLGSGVVGVVYLLVPLWQSVAGLLVVTFAVSFVMPLRFVSLNTVFMAQLERIGEARAGWFRGTHMIGMFLLGPVLGAALVHAAGHAASFVAIASLFGLTMLAAPAVFRQSPVDEDAAAPGPRRGIAAIVGLLGDPRARALALQEATVQALNAYYAFYIVVIAVQHYGLPAADAGALVAVQGAAFVAALFLLGGWSAALGARCVPLAAAGTVAGTLALAAAPSAAWLWPAGVLLGAALGLLQIQTLTRFARLGGLLGRGRVAGLQALVGPSGGLLGGLVGGTLGARFGLQACFLVFVPLFVGIGWAAGCRGSATAPDAA